MKRKKAKNAPNSKSPQRRKNHISHDGKWETMSTRGLMRYRPSRVFFGRTRYKRKLLKGTLETTDYDEACERLPEYKKSWKGEYDRFLEEGEKKIKNPTTWRVAADLLDTQLLNRANAGDILHISADWRRTCIHRILFYWPSIEDRFVRDLSPEECLAFFAEARTGKARFTARPGPKGRLRQKGEFHGGKQDNSTFNRMLGVFKDIVKIAVKRDIKLGFPPTEDPLEGISWAAGATTPPLMPSDEEWEKILTAMGDTRLYRNRKVCESQVLCAKFMAMTGARISEIIGRTKHSHKEDAPHPGFRWKDMRDGYNIIICAKKRKDNKWKPRPIPWIDGAKELMDEIREKLYQGDDNALVFSRICSSGLSRALPRALRGCALWPKYKGFTQHKIRHLFGTKCAEAGCTWKALGELLGHEDGGILAARTYSHVRCESIIEQAALVSYGHKNARDTGRTNGVHTENQKVKVNEQEFTLNEVQDMAAKYLAQCNESAKLTNRVSSGE